MFEMIDTGHPDGWKDESKAGEPIVEACKKINRNFDKLNRMDNPSKAALALRMSDYTRGSIVLWSINFAIWAAVVLVEVCR